MFASSSDRRYRLYTGSTSTGAPLMALMLLMLVAILGLGVVATLQMGNSDDNDQSRRPRLEQQNG
jgi:uncharacterized protein HemX